MFKVESRRPSGIVNFHKRKFASVIRKNRFRSCSYENAHLSTISRRQSQLQSIHTRSGLAVVCISGTFDGAKRSIQWRHAIKGEIKNDK